MARWGSIQGRWALKPLKWEYNDAQSLEERDSMETRKAAWDKIMRGKAWQPHLGAMISGQWVCVQCGNTAKDADEGKSTPCAGWRDRLTTHVWCLMRHPGGCKAEKPALQEAVMANLARRLRTGEG